MNRNLEIALVALAPMMVIPLMRWMNERGYTTTGTKPEDKKEENTAWKKIWI